MDTPRAGDGQRGGRAARRSGRAAGRGRGRRPCGRLVAVARRAAGAAPLSQAGRRDDDPQRPPGAAHRVRAPATGTRRALDRGRAARRQYLGVAAVHQRWRTGAPADASLRRGAAGIPGAGARAADPGGTGAAARRRAARGRPGALRPHRPGERQRRARMVPRDAARGPQPRGAPHLERGRARGQPPDADPLRQPDAAARPATRAVAARHRRGTRRTRARDRLGRRGATASRGAGDAGRAAPARRGQRTRRSGVGARTVGGCSQTRSSTGEA